MSKKDTDTPFQKEKLRKDTTTHSNVRQRRSSSPLSSKEKYYHNIENDTGLNKTVIVQSAKGRRVYNVSVFSQVLMVGLLVLLGTWCGIATTNWFINIENNDIQQSKTQSIINTYKLRTTYLEEERDRISASLDDAEMRFSEMTHKISENALKEKGNSTISPEILVQLDTVKQRLNTVVEERNRLRRKFDDASIQLAEYSTQIGDVNTRNDESRVMLASLSERLTQAVEERDTLQARLSVLKNEMLQSNADVNSLGSDHEEAIVELERIAEKTLKNVRKTLGKTGVDVTQLLGSVKSTKEGKEFTGQGGPYMPLDKIAIRGERSLAAAMRLQSIFDQFEEINLLTIASDKIPFGMPTKTKRMSSGFGYRKDPFRRKTAFHSGLDFPGPVGTPIYSTSDGTVVFAGRKSGYGNFVEINHGIGFTTRYAHLSKFSVAVGQKIRQGDRIASMGNTGRSTGSHLHYEIRYKGKALNPANFTNNTGK